MKRDSSDQYREAIELGIRDLDPSRVSNWCKHIKVEYLSTSPLGEMVRLPTLGMKRISCPYGKGTIESVSLDTAALGFYDNNCKDCKKHEEINWNNMFRMKNPFFRFMKFTKNLAFDFYRVLLFYKEYVIIFLLFGFVYVFLESLNVRFSETVLVTLAQVNATIFALAFTIPLIANQLGKYSSATPIFKGFSLTYMLFYISVIFLPLIGPSAIATLCVSLSILSTMLLIPYLRWMKNSLSAPRIIQDYNRRALSSMVKKSTSDFKEAIDDIYNLAMQAYSLKDYGTLEQTLDQMVKLARYSCCIDFRITSTTPEEEFAWLYVGRRIQRIGENIVEDRTALQIICEKILWLDTNAEPFKNRIFTLPLKTMEFVSLSVLAKFVCERNEINAMHPVAALFEHALGATYDDERINEKIRNDIITFFVSLPERVIDYAYGILETRYKTRYGGGILKIGLLGMLAKFYLEYRDIRFPKEKKEKRAEGRK